MSEENPTMQPGQFCWNELLTGNVAQAKEFYGSLLNWTVEAHDMGEKVYHMIKSGDKEIGGIMAIADTGQEMPPHWNSYIYVEDLAATLNKAESLGATVVCPVTACGEFGSMAVIQDPTGAHISLWQSA